MEAVHPPVRKRLKRLNILFGEMLKLLEPGEEFLHGFGVFDIHGHPELAVFHLIEGRKVGFHRQAA